MAYYQCAGRVVSATRAIAPSVLRARAAGVSSSGGRAAHSAGSCCAPAHAAATIAKRACSTVADASGAASLKHKPHPLPLDHDGAALTLIQYPICPFCCTARAYLDYHGVPYRPLDVNPITKAGLHNHPAVKGAIERGRQYNNVPVAVLPAIDPISGSLEIINHLEALGVASTARSAQAENSIDWAYSYFVKLFPINIYRNPAEAWEVFRYISDTDLSVADKVKIRVGGAGLMWAVSTLKIKRKLGVKDERQALYDAGREWMQRVHGPAAGKTGTTDKAGSVPSAGVVVATSGGADGDGHSEAATRNFHGGAEPDLADIVVWGMLNAMSGMRALADLRMEVSQLDKWFTAMQVQMVSAAVVDPVHAEGVSSDDEIRT